MDVCNLVSKTEAIMSAESINIELSTKFPMEHNLGTIHAPRTTIIVVHASESIFNAQSFDNQVLT